MEKKSFVSEIAANLGRQLEEAGIISNPSNIPTAYPFEKEVRLAGRIHPHLTKIIILRRQPGMNKREWQSFRHLVAKIIQIKNEEESSLSAFRIISMAS